MSMYESIERHEEGPLYSRPGVPRGQSVIAWIVIIVVALAVVILHMTNASGGAQGRQQIADEHIVELMEGRLLVGMDAIGWHGYASSGLVGFERGTLGRRVRGIILAGEMSGDESARDLLLRLEVQLGEGGVEPDEVEIQIMVLLDRIYATPAEAERVPGDLDATEQAALIDALGWFGELALNPAGRGPTPMRSTLINQAVFVMLVLTLAGGGFLCGLFIGLVLLVLIIVFACSSKLIHAFGEWNASDGLLAETFAIWMVVFFVLQIALGWLVSEVSVLQEHALFIVGLVQGGTVVLVAWPVIRGRSWQRTREAIGWTSGTGFWKEFGWGFCGYLMMLPLLAIGVLLVYLLMALTSGPAGSTDFAPDSAPAHPIMLDVATGDLWMILQVYFVAALVAPFLEETLFRGVLYRHLRTATRRWSVVWSVVISILIVSLVFAAIHPQGLLAIPALASIAVGLALMREWRGSLIAPMVMHGCSNGLVITMMAMVVR